jgi:hypothetical protein
LDISAWIPWIRRAQVLVDHVFCNVSCFEFGRRDRLAGSTWARIQAGILGLHLGEQRMTIPLLMRLSPSKGDCSTELVSRTFVLYRSLAGRTQIPRAVSTASFV